MNKTFQKIAGTLAIVMIVALIATFTRQNWGPAADKAINSIATAVTGADWEIEVFTPAKLEQAQNGKVDTKWK